MSNRPFIGQKDRKIQIYELSKTRTDTASEKTSKHLVCDVFAYMQDTGGNEQLEGKIIHLIDRTYIIRYNRFVREKGNQFILVDNGKEYQIIHVSEIGRKDHLEIIVKLYE